MPIDCYRYCGCIVCGYYFVQKPGDLPETGYYNCESSIAVIEDNISVETFEILGKYDCNPGTPDPNTGLRGIDWDNSLVVQDYYKKQKEILED
jgi:hypothetical protein